MKNKFYTILMLVGIAASAQNTEHSKDNLDFGADFQSRYIWRGLELGGSSASVQPNLEFSSGNLSVGVWAAYSLGGVNQFQETDLYLNLAVSKSVAITLTDYYFPQDGISNNYFSLGKSTGHVYEFMLSFSSLFKSPLGFTAATNFAGADKNGVKQNYSTYLELSYSKTINNVSYSFVAGGVIGDNGGYYLTNGAGLINLGISASKEIKLSNTYNLPVNAALTFNPDQENIYLTFGFSL